MANMGTRWHMDAEPLYNAYVCDNHSTMRTYVTTQHDTKANEVEDWDSLNHIEIVVAVEKHFKIKFNFAELQKFQNVGQMCDNIVVKLAQAGG